jgi:glycosyltransferase involved in cell wall biosynthesis
MHILFSTPKFAEDPHIGTLSLLAERLAIRGHSVTGIQEPGEIGTDSFPVTELQSPPVRFPWWARLWHYYSVWSERVNSHLQEHDPDVIVSDRRTHVPTLQGARTSNTPVVAIIEGLGFMRFAPEHYGPSKEPSFLKLPVTSQLQYPFVRSLFRQQSRSFPEFSAVVTLSDFLSDTISTTFGVESTTIPTMVDRSHVAANSHTPTYVTMVNPRTELKGANIFVEIATQLSDVEFLVAGTFGSADNRREVEKLSNVTYLGWVDDMKSVYERTSVLLVPSLVEEGGPRIICEAFANQIPVVGTNRGGVPEFIDDAGAVIQDPYDIDEWEQNIRSCLESRAHLSSLAEEQSSRFDADTATDQYEALLSNIV